MTSAEAGFRDPGSRAGAGHPKPDSGRETGTDREVILTLDHGVLLVHDPRAAEAAYIDEIFEKASRRQVRTILWRTLAGARGLYRSRSVPFQLCVPRTSSYDAEPCSSAIGADRKLKPLSETTSKCWLLNCAVNPSTKLPTTRRSVLGWMAARAARWSANTRTSAQS